MSWGVSGPRQQGSILDVNKIGTSREHPGGGIKDMV